MDIGSITAAVSGLKTAADLAKGFLDLKSVAEVQGKVIELQSVILAAQTSALAAQSDQFSLIERIRDLEAKMASLEAWNTEKQRYQLEQIAVGGFAYVLKAASAGDEPPHLLCASCYDAGSKSILQQVKRMPYPAVVEVCHKCGSEIYTHGQWRPEHGMTRSASRRKS